MLRKRFLNILPNKVKAKINDEPKLHGNGFLEIAIWCKNHVLLEQPEALAEVTKKVLAKELGRCIHALSPKDDIDEQDSEEAPPPATPDPRWSRRGAEDPDAPPGWAKNLFQLVIMAINEKRGRRNPRDDTHGHRPTRTPSQAIADRCDFTEANKGKG